MKVLLTGSTGFLGQAIVREFLQHNIEIIGISKTSEQFKADVTDKKSLLDLSLSTDIDVVIHSAGLAHQFGKTTREKFFDVNVKGTENLLFLSKSLNIKHFILISSVAVYGESANVKIKDGKFQEDSECRPIGDYAESKYEAEKSAIKYCTENKINLTILRPATIIGEGDKGNVMRLITTIKNRHFFWIGRGENLKSLVDKNDVATVCRIICQNLNTGFQIFNITGKPLIMREVVETIADESGVKISKFYIPHIFAVLAAKFTTTIKKWLSDDIFSGDKITKQLNFTPRSDIKDTLRREVRSLES